MFLSYRNQSADLLCKSTDGFYMMETLAIKGITEDHDGHETSIAILEPTCFKSINPTCIDNFLTSKKARFMNTLTYEDGISDHHKLTERMLRSTFPKGNPKKIFYRSYKNFDNEKFKKNQSFYFAFKTTLD